MEELSNSVQYADDRCFYYWILNAYHNCMAKTYWVNFYFPHVAIEEVIISLLSKHPKINIAYIGAKHHGDKLVRRVFRHADNVRIYTGNKLLNINDTQKLYLQYYCDALMPPPKQNFDILFCVLRADKYLPVLTKFRARFICFISSYEAPSSFIGTTINFYT